MQRLQLAGAIASAYLIAACSGSDQGPYHADIISYNQAEFVDSAGNELSPSNCLSAESLGRYCSRFELPLNSSDYIKSSSYIVADDFDYPVFGPFGPKLKTFYQVAGLVEVETYILGGQNQVGYSGDTENEFQLLFGGKIEKIAANGDVLADDALEWACIRNKQSGLMWEHKTNDSSSIHYYAHQFNYFDGQRGIASTQGQCAGINCDTQSLMTAVNSKNYCGRSNWRLPSNHELYSVQVTSSLAINQLPELQPSTEPDDFTLKRPLFFDKNTPFDYAPAVWSSDVYSQLPAEVLARSRGSQTDRGLGVSLLLSSDILGWNYALDIGHNYLSAPVDFAVSAVLVSD